MERGASPMTTGLTGYPVYSKCDKCGTENSLLYEFRPGYWICKANECFTEDEEHELARQEELNRQQEEYQRLVSGTNV